MVRWIIRILGLFLVLILVAALIVYFVLQSDWLNEQLLAGVSEHIGMEVTAETLNVGWRGDTTLGGTAIRMPLTDEVILSADRIELVHEPVASLILGRPFNVRAVRVDSPEVNLRQDETGRWNIEDAWTQLQAILDIEAPADRRAVLPEVEIRDGLIHITTADGRYHALGPVDFQARPHGRLLWQFELDAPELSAEGRTIRGGDWAHRVGFEISNVESLVHQLLDRDLSRVRVSGRWEGRVLQDSLRGTLRLDTLAVGPVEARGSILVEAGPDRLMVSPVDLVLSEPGFAGQPLRLAGGPIRIGNGQIEVERLAAASDTLIARLSGRWDSEARAGEFSGSWVATPEDGPAQYSGTYQAVVTSPLLGRREARVSMTARAQTEFGLLNVAAEAQGAGADWWQSHWRLSAPTLRWSNGVRQVDMTGATAELRLSWPEVRLTSLHLPDADAVDANAWFDTRTRQWSARLETDDLGLLRAWGAEALDIRVIAEGDAQRARFSELRLAEGERIIQAAGNLSFAERGLHDFHLTADWPVGPVRPEQPQAGQPIGRWHLAADVSGQVHPLDIELVGQLTGQNIPLGRQMFDYLDIPVQADVDARRVRIATEPFDLLGGRWRAGGQHELATDVTQMSVTADGLSLEAAAELAGLPPLSHGRADAQIRLAVRNLDIASAVATGSWTAEDISIPPVEAERARGELRIAGGLVRFDQIFLEQEGGQAEASVEFRLDNPQFVSVELTSREWPIHSSILAGRLPAPTETIPARAETISASAGAVREQGSPVAQIRPAIVATDHPDDEGLDWSVYVDSQAKLRLDVIGRTADGEAQVGAKVLLEGQELAQIRMSTLVEDQTLDIHELHVRTLDGVVEGRARIPLHRWKDSAAKLNWQGVQPRLLQRWVPQFERFEGVMSGSLHVEQVDPAQRPPEPLRFVLDVDIENGRFGPARVDVCHVIGYLGDTRLLIDRADFRVLGGQLNARARISRHWGSYYGSIATDFNDLDLDQLARVVNADIQPGDYVGRLSGDITALASSDWKSFGGEARLSITRSDLVGSRIVRTLYNTLLLQFGEREPTGMGDVIIRLEGASVLIPSFSYFNRGVEIRGAGEIEDITLGVSSPVNGFAVGSTRVLRGIELPGVAALDRLLATFQAGAASVQIGGTLEDVDVDVVPLPAVAGGLRRLLWAQLRG